MPCHGIRDESSWDTLGHKFPCRETRSLKERAGFGGDNADFFVLLVGCHDHAKGCAVSSGSQRPCIAVGQDSETIPYEFSARL